jgi:hypothetical protein
MPSALINSATALPRSGCTALTSHPVTSIGPAISPQLQAIANRDTTGDFSLSTEWVGSMHWPTVVLVAGAAVTGGVAWLCRRGGWLSEPPSRETELQAWRQRWRDEVERPVEIAMATVNRQRADALAPHAGAAPGAHFDARSRRHG